METVSKTKIMAVIGMHRSATSGVSKGIHLAGWPMASSEACMIQPSVSNPYGHWEDQELVNMNDRILYELGGAWNSPPDQSDVEARREEFIPLVCNYIRSRISQHSGGQWGIKDPRLVLLWPIWKDAFDQFPDIEVITVHVWRDEEAIAKSLVARNDVDQAKADALTRHYHDLQGQVR